MEREGGREGEGEGEGGREGEGEERWKVGGCDRGRERGGTSKESVKLLKILKSSSGFALGSP